MIPTTPEDRRARVDAIKRDWQRDPCFDLAASVADDFPEFKDEIEAFEREHLARSEAEVAAKHTARRESIVQRMLGRVPDHARTDILSDWRMMHIAHTFAEEIMRLEDRIGGADRQAGLAHERLDQIGARGADSERT